MSRIEKGNAKNSVTFFYVSFLLRLLSFRLIGTVRNDVALRFTPLTDCVGRIPLESPSATALVSRNSKRERNFRSLFAIVPLCLSP